MDKPTMRTAIAPGIVSLFVIVVFACDASSRAQDGVLQQARREVREPAAAAPETPSSRDEDKEREEEYERRRRRETAQEEQGFWDQLIGPLFIPAIVGAGTIVTVPFWGPPVWVGDDYAYVAKCASYPYEDDICGYLYLPPRRSDTKSWSLRARGEYADDFDGLQRMGGQVLWESAMRLGVDSTFDYRREKLGQALRDELWTGDANLVFRFAQSEHLTMRAGAGVNWLSDAIATDLGFNFTYAGDWFPLEPWIFSTELDLGYLGDAGLLHLRTTVGVNYRNAEIYCGYDWTRIGDVDLGGFVSGIRFWF